MTLRLSSRASAASRAGTRLRGCRTSVTALLLIAVAAHAQTPVVSYRYRLLGVYNSQSGEAIEGAVVIDVMAKTSALTTRTGTVTLVFLPEGANLVRVQKVGFKPVTMMVEISPADTVPLTVVLESVAQTLPTVVTTDSAPRYISPGVRGFEERRAKGFGYFIGEAELRKQDARKMTNVVRTLPGLTILCPRQGPRRGECWPASFRMNSKLGILGGGSCDVEVYIDGHLSEDNDLERKPVNEYAAVEYYAGGATMPIQYNKTGSACGVLLLWTRER